MRFTLEPATDKKHKYIGVFTTDDKTTRVPFGAYGMSDMTLHKNPVRRARYIARHRARENWNDPMTAGALSRWILWQTPNLATNVRMFKSKYNLT